MYWSSGIGSGAGTSIPNPVRNRRRHATRIKKMMKMIQDRGNKISIRTLFGIILQKCCRGKPRILPSSLQKNIGEVVTRKPHMSGLNDKIPRSVFDGFVKGAGGARGLGGSSRRSPRDGRSYRRSAAVKGFPRTRTWWLSSTLHPFAALTMRLTLPREVEW